MAYLRCTGAPGGSLKLRTAQGEIASFETNMADVLQEVKCEINATGGNGTPDNPNPINGYTEANIVNTQNESIVDLFSIDSDFRGTVAFNQLARFENTVKQGLTATMDINGVVSILGTATAAWSNITYPIEPIDNHKYFIGRTIIANPNNISLYWGFLNVNQTPRNSDLVSSGSSYNIVNINSHTGQSTGFGNIESGTDFTGFKFKLVCIDLTQMFGSTIADYIYSLERATAGAGVAFFRSIYPADYYDYDVGTNELVGKETPETTIAFGQTVYGGVLDVTRGKLHVTWANLTFVDLSTKGWAVSSSGIFYLYPIATAMPNILLPIVNNPLCSSFAYQPSGTMENNTFRISDALYVKTDEAATVADFKTWLANNTGSFAYELATPFDIDLTPEVISAVVGTNNVYSDTNGDTEVKYLEVVRN